MKRTYLLFLLSLYAASAQSQMHWQAAPHGDGHGHQHGQPGFQLIDGEGASSQVIRPDLQPVVLKMVNGVAKPKPTKMDNYHALVAERSIGNQHDSAIRYITLRGKPSGHSPSELTASQKAELEIVPTTLPREHRHYYSGKQVAFEVRFRGWSLSQVPVTLTTSNGSQLTSSTDVGGQAVFTLPEDFTDIRPGRENNPAADFVLTVRYQQAGERYTSTLSMPYYVNPGHWQSSSLALAVGAGGFISGIGIMRLRRKQEEGK
jgi:hypothetical protein